MVLDDSDAIQVIAHGDGYCFAAWQNLYVLDFRSTPTIEALEQSVRGKSPLVARNPEGIVVLNLLGAGVSLPSAQVRAYAAKLQADTQGVRCQANVIEATGFTASAMRSILTGLWLIDRTPFPRSVFASVSDALRWAATTCAAPPAWLPAALKAVEEIRRR